MKKGKLIFALIGIAFCCSACSEVEQLEQTQEYQQAKQTLGSGMQYVWEKAAHFVQNNEEVQKGIELVNQQIDLTKEQAAALAEHAKAEVSKQYDQLKNEAKEQVKSSVNQKIDHFFE